MPKLPSRIPGTVLLAASALITGCQPGSTVQISSSPGGMTIAVNPAGTVGVPLNPGPAPLTAAPLQNPLTGNLIPQLGGVAPGGTAQVPPSGPSKPGAAPPAGGPGNGLKDSGALAQWRGGKLSPAQFFALLGPSAQSVQARTGIPAAIILAQAALETGYGSSTIGSARNLFGIKGTGPAGSVSAPTTEVVNGRSIRVTAQFRAYNSWTESLEDHAKLLTTSPRYRDAMRYTNDPEQFARELQRAGYATDPGYANKLIAIMRENNLVNRTA